MTSTSLNDSRAIPSSPLFTIHLSDEAVGMQGFLVVHSMGPHGASGGVRICSDIELSEITTLARLMTYKFCFWERPLGGAKAGLIISPEAPAELRTSILKSFGRQLAPILSARMYHPGLDMNCSAEDLRTIFSAAGLPAGQIIDSAYYTALTVMGALTGAAKFLGITPSSCKIVIEGLGKVGAYLAREIDNWGGKLIAASTLYGGLVNTNGLSISQLEERKNQAGERFVQEPGPWQCIPKENMFELEADIFVPCARTCSINETVARELNVRAVIPAANGPCTAAGEKILQERGVLILPDFVCNTGGILGTNLAGLGAKPIVIKDLLCKKFAAMVIRMLEKARKSGVEPTELSRTVAHDNYYRRANNVFGRLTLTERLFKALRWRGLIPRPYLLKQAYAETCKLIENKFQ